MEMGDWDLESVFIEKVIEELPWRFNFGNVLTYLEKGHNENTYNQWVRIKDEIISRLVVGEFIPFNYNPYKKLVTEDELQALKNKLQTNELEVVKRINFIAINESIHADDENNR